LNCTQTSPQAVACVKMIMVISIHQMTPVIGSIATRHYSIPTHSPLSAFSKCCTIGRGLVTTEILQIKLQQNIMHVGTYAYRKVFGMHVWDSAKEIVFV